MPLYCCIVVRDDWDNSPVKQVLIVLSVVSSDVVIKQ